MATPRESIKKTMENNNVNCKRPKTHIATVRWSRSLLEKQNYDCAVKIRSDLLQIAQINRWLNKIISRRPAKYIPKHCQLQFIVALLKSIHQWNRLQIRKKKTMNTRQPLGITKYIGVGWNIKFENTQIVGKRDKPIKKKKVENHYKWRS